MVAIPRVLIVISALTVMVGAKHASADGSIDADTVVSTSHGTFNGVEYTRCEAMFQGTTSNNRPYRVPCQIIAPSNPSEGSGLLLFDWIVPSTIGTAIAQEQADARYTLSDEFLFGLGVSYATVRCSLEGIGQSSPVANYSRPWSDDLLDTSSEFITSAGDEFDIVVDYVQALRSDPVALERLGTITRRAAFAYSASGYRLRGLLRLKMGQGLFDFSLVGGAGNGYAHPAGNKISFTLAEKPPLPGVGLEIDFQSETDVVALGAHKTRHEESNYRVYQFAGTSHLRDIDCYEFGLAEPETANSAEWTPFFRSLFVAANNWCDGIEPPPSLWLGAPNSLAIARDANGNALVTYRGGLPISTDQYRLPEVAVGQNQYIPVAPQFDDGTFLGGFRAFAGSRIDLTWQITDHAAYVDEVTTRALDLVSQGYLLQADADDIIQKAADSDIGE